MALPTLQPFWLKNYKNTSEALMVKRNQDQNEFRQKWDKNSQFFKRSEVEAVKQTGWTSNESYQRSMDKIGEVYKRSTKQVELERRKNLLAEMLCKETESFERELRDKRLSKAGNLLEMRDRADELKEAREERRKQLAEEKLYEHWKENEPELRKVQSSQMQKHVITGWGEQVTEREDIKKTARDEERRLDHMMELNQLREIEKERMKAEQKKEEEVQLKSELLKQMEQLKMKEEEGQMLKREEEDLEKHKMIVDAAEEKRRQFDEQRRKQEYGRVLVRQYKAQLRRKSKQVQDALELDLKILEDLSRQGKDEIAVKTSRREKARADAEEMRKVVAEQLKLEKAREAELDMMYQEEAARQWQKRESEWERERIARERLMKEVLDERQKQLDNRMQVVLRKKEESIADREELIRKMENHQKYIEEEREEEIFRKKEREREINEQITSRTERQRDHALREQQLLEQKRREEEAYKRMLESEIGGMTAREETPRSFHRRKFAFQ